MSELSGFHHVALTVPDLDTSAAWYHRVLGLVWHAATTGNFDPRRVGLDHFSFVVERRRDLDAWVQRLDDESVAHSGVVDVPPGAMLNFKDPDGIALAIFWDR